MQINTDPKQAVKETAGVFNKKKKVISHNSSHSSWAKDSNKNVFMLNYQINVFQSTLNPKHFLAIEMLIS